jgi:glutathione S-transferase
MALIDAILEDWADEWLTKAMFHYRWAFEDDAKRAAAILPRWSRTERADDEIAMRGRMFADRQIGRLGVVGSDKITGPFIEDSYRRALAVLNARLADSRFLLGGRPAACDFAVYGQLTQLVAFDPTPSAIALAESPRVVAWVDVVDELSGLEPSASDWTRRDEAGSESLRALLMEVGRVYVPFLLANASAVADGADRVECKLDSHAWTQKPFPYQAKCLTWLREEHAALHPSDRAAADALLAGTGCESLFA